MSERFDTGVVETELEIGRGRFVETPWGSFALFRTTSGTFCVQAFCPHLEGPLFQGSLAGADVVCPWHLWRFSLATGERLDLGGMLTRARDRLRTCAVRTSERGTLELDAPAR